MEEIIDPLKTRNPDQDQIIDENLFGGEHTQSRMHHIGEQFILFMFKYYQVETDDSLLEIFGLVENLYDFFGFRDDSLTDAIVVLVKEMFDCDQFVEAKKFKLAVENYEGCPTQKPEQLFCSRRKPEKSHSGIRF